MAGGGKGGGKRGAERASGTLPASEAPAETLHTPRQPPEHEALVTAMGGGTLDFPAMLAIADLLPVLTAYVDHDLVLRFVNRPMAEWIGLPRSEILGQHMRVAIGEEGFAQREPLLHDALAGERKFFASEFTHPVNGPVALQTDYIPWADAGGVIRGLLIIVQDVTEQRAAERSIRESEARFRRIANSAPVMMWVTRIDRVRDFVNQAYAEFVCGPGCNVDEARTVDWRTRIHPDDVDRIVAESIAGEASLQPFTLEGRYLRHDGEWRWLRSVSQPRFGADGGLSGFIGVASDITVAKEAELELRREVEERTRDLALSEARFRAVFEAALEVMVLLEPDGTVIAVNNRREVWRHPDAERGHWHQAVGRADAQGLSAAHPDHARGDREGGAAGKFSPPK